MKRKIISLLLTVALLFGVVSMTTVEASAASLKASESCIALLKQMEGFISKPVWDYSQYSVGYGSRVEKDSEEYKRYMESGITEKEADALLRTYVAIAEKSINAFNTNNGLGLNQNQFDALIIFSYNCGTGWINGSGEFRTAVVNHSTGNTFLDAIASWCKAGGAIQRGLIVRRLAEANIYLNGVYSTAQPAQYCYVLFNAFGGYCGTQVIAYDASSPITALPAASRSGYAFKGWYNASAGGTQITTLDSGVNGRTLFARWEKEGGSSEPSTPDIKEVNYQRVVKVSTSLNVREEPDSNTNIVKVLHNGDPVTIVAETTSNGMLWGKLEGGGWIALQYTEAPGSTEEPEKPAEPEKPSEPETPATNVTNIKVTGSVVNVRSGAGTNYPVVTSVRSGQTVGITETATVSGSLWGKMTDGNWLCLTYTDYKSASQPATPEKPSESGNTGSAVSGTVTASSLNIRSGAGTSSSIVGSYKKGDSVTILEQTTAGGTAWGKTDRGWISMSYVSTGSNSGSNSGNNSGGSGTSVTITGDVVNVRSGAGTGNGVIAAVYRGQGVTIVETATANGSTWGKIANSGWICLSYTNYGGSSSSETPSNGGSNSGSTGGSTGGYTATITASSLNIRSSAGTSSSVVGGYGKGETVTILEETTAGGTAWGRTDRGWISLSYVSTSGSGGSTSGTYTVTGDVVNVRSGAGTGNGVISAVYRGQSVTIVATTTSGGMTWGQLSSGGWISMSYVK